MMFSKTKEKNPEYKEVQFLAGTGVDAWLIFFLYRLRSKQKKSWIENNSNGRHYQTRHRAKQKRTHKDFTANAAGIKIQDGGKIWINLNENNEHGPMMLSKPKENNQD